MSQEDITVEQKNYADITFSSFFLWERKTYKNKTTDKFSYISLLQLQCCKKKKERKLKKKIKKAL